MSMYGCMKIIFRNVLAGKSRWLIQGRSMDGNQRAGIRGRKRKRALNVGVKQDLPDFEKKVSHKKKKKDELVNGKYTSEDLDHWADLIKRRKCTYEGIAKHYPVSVGALHRRVKQGIGKGQMGPKKVFSKDEESQMIDFLDMAAKQGKPLLKSEFKAQLQEFVVVNRMQHRFRASVPTYGLLENFIKEYKEEVRFDTLKDRRERSKAQGQITIEDWVQQRDAFIKENFEALPACKHHILILDKLTLTSRSQPPVTFDVLFLVSCIGKVFTPYFVDDKGIDPNFLELYKDRIEKIEYTGRQMDVSSFLKLFNKCERYFAAEEIPFPGTMYLMPQVHDLFRLSVFRDASRKGFNLICVPDRIESILVGFGAALSTEVANKFQMKVEKRGALDRFTPLDFLRSLAETFEGNTWIGKVKIVTRLLKLASGVPKITVPPAIPPGVNNWVNRRNQPFSNAVRRGSKKVLQKLGESDSSSED